VVVVIRIAKGKVGAYRPMMAPDLTKQARFIFRSHIGRDSIAPKKKEHEKQVKLTH
jgi:hypothetical protein